MMMIKVNNNQLLNYREICMLTFIVESSIVGTELSFFKGLKAKSHQCEVEYINTHDVIAFSSISHE